MILIIIISSIFIPVEAGVNEVIDELRVRGVPVVRFVNTMPYKVEWKEGMLNVECLMFNVKGKEIGKNVGNGRDDICSVLMRRLDYLDISTPEGRFYVEGYGVSDTVSRYFQDAGLIASLPGFDICIQPFIKVGESDEYPIYMWYNDYPTYIPFDKVGGDLRRAYGSVEFGGFDIILGREILRWGPLPGHSFILSGFSPTFDLFSFSYEYSLFKGSFFFTSLESYILDDTFDVWWRDETFPKGTLIKRFLSGHRIDFTFLNDRLLVGLSEVIMYSGNRISLISGYLNPFNFFYRYRHNRGGESYTDNIGISFDLSYYIKDGLCVYGQLFIDDAKFAKDIYNIPSMLGYNIGFKTTLGKNFWSLQYTRVDTWTYIHQLYWNNYLFLGYPIGHPKGQDFNELYGRVVHHLNYNWDVTLDVWLTRKGENNFDKLWPGTFPEHQKFPSGVVERSISIEAGVSFFNLPGFSAKFVGGYTWIGDYKHIIDETRWFPSIKLKFSRYM